MSDVPEQTIFPLKETRDTALQLLSFAICRLVDIGKSITIDRLHFERDKLKHGVDRLERSSFAFAYHMDSQKEDEKRGENIAGTAKKSSTDTVHYNTIDAPGHRGYIMNMTAGASQANAAIIEVPDDVFFTIAQHSGNQSARVIQGQHSRSNTPILIKQTCNDVHRTDSDNAGHEQERYDETSDALQNEHPYTVLFLNARCVAHSRNAELRTLCNNAEGSCYLPS